MEHKFGGRWNTTASTYLSHSAVVIPCESAPPSRTGKKGEDESDPPKKWGGHVTPDSGTEEHTAIRSHAGRSRPHLSLREGLEQPAPEGR